MFLNNFSIRPFWAIIQIDINLSYTNMLKLKTNKKQANKPRHLLLSNHIWYCLKLMFTITSSSVLILFEKSPTKNYCFIIWRRYKVEAFVINSFVCVIYCYEGWFILLIIINCMISGLLNRVESRFNCTQLLTNSNILKGTKKSFLWPYVHSLYKLYTHPSCHFIDTWICVIYVS